MPGIRSHLIANSAAIVLTDPPYLARYRDRSGRTVPRRGDEIRAIKA
jgi:hypothetical protein